MWEETTQGRYNGSAIPVDMQKFFAETPLAACIDCQPGVSFDYGCRPVLPDLATVKAPVAGVAAGRRRAMDPMRARGRNHLAPKVRAFLSSLKSLPLFLK